MSIKHHKPQSRSSILRAREQIGKDFDSALPILMGTEYEQRCRFFRYHYEEYVQRILSNESSTDFKLTDDGIKILMSIDPKYSRPQYFFHLDLPEVEQEVIAMQVLSQGRGGVHNSALNRKRDCSKGYAVPIEDIPRSQRRFSTTEESCSYQTRLASNRKHHTQYANHVPPYRGS